MRTVLSQGSDLVGLGDNLLLKAAEYTAKYNLNGTVVYDPKWYRCEAVLVGGPWKNISDAAFGVRSKIPIWEHIYYEYVVKKGVNAPWTTKARAAVGFEGGAVQPSINDHPSWGSLLWAV